MPVTILAPLQDDTVASPVTVTVGYSFASGTFTLTAAVGSNADPNPPNVSGDSVYSVGITVAAPGTYQVTATTTPSSGGSDSQSPVNVTSGEPPVKITGVDKHPPTDTGKKKYKVKGKFKNQTPAITKVVCVVYEVDVTNHSRTQVASGEDPHPDGSNHSWKVDVQFTVNPARRYVARASAYSNGTLVSSFSKWIDT